MADISYLQNEDVEHTDERVRTLNHDVVFEYKSTVWNIMLPLLASNGRRFFCGQECEFNSITESQVELRFPRITMIPHEDSSRKEVILSLNNGEMANNTEIESRNCEYDQQDSDGDGGGGDEGGGPLHPLDAMAKLQQYASCEMPYNRQLVGRILVEIFRGAVDDGTELNVTEVMQPIYKLVNDTDANVRQELVEQLPHVAMICQEAPDRFGNVLSNHLIRIIVNFHHDGDQQVRQSTHIALLKLIERGLLDRESAEFIVAPTLLRMPLLPAKLEFHRAIDRHGEYRMFLKYVARAVPKSTVSPIRVVVMWWIQRISQPALMSGTGMSKVAPLLEPNTAERLFLRRFLMLCNDDNFFIRKSCAMHFGEFAAAMTKDTLYELLLPMYETLCKDPIWSVRKCCVDAMVSVACCVSLEYRRTTLSQILANLLDDDSKWVRLSAFQILGPFITTFAKRFTGFTYKQYGELVLTDQHGTELRYNIISFLGMGELSASCTAASDEDFGSDNDRLNPPSRDELAPRNVEIQYRRKTLCTTDMNKENIPVSSDTSNEFQQKSLWNYSTGQQQQLQHQFTTDGVNKSPESYELYNPFLYYYIPPDLPLDQELINALTSENVLTNQPEVTTTEYMDNSNMNIELSATNLIGKSNQDAINKKQISEPYGISTEIIMDNETDNNEDLMMNDGQNSTQEIWKSMNDTIDISSISSGKNDSMMETKTATGMKHGSDMDGQGIVPQELIDFFVSMAEPEAYYDLKWNSVEIPRFCAFCFPAVVLTLGRENWPMLKTAYEYLSDAREYKVRRTMASSIHEVALILGAELSAQDLLPIYDGFIKDLDEVRIGALKHLATFLKVLKPEDRSQFLPRLQAFLSMDNEWNWRFREEVATQFLQAISLYTTIDVSTHIAPLSFPLLVDKVAAVRQMALELVTEIVSYLSSDEDLVTAIIEELRMMLTAFTSRWTCRQTFALLCASLLKHNAIGGGRFAKELLPSLLTLASDVVPNVRLAVMRTLKTQVIHISDSLTVDQKEKINQEIKTLRLDRDRDVRTLAGTLRDTDYINVKVFEALKRADIR